MIKSGFRETTVSILGLIMPPMLGSWQAEWGYLQKSVTAITRSSNPSSKRVSVMEGEVEMIRSADLLSVLPAQRVDNERQRKQRLRIIVDTTAIQDLDNARVICPGVRKLLLRKRKELNEKKFTGISSFQRNEGQSMKFKGSLFMQ